MAEQQVNGESQGHTAKVLEHGKALRDDAEALAGEIRGAVEEIQDKIDIQGRMERNPYGTLAIAAGVGYVLGGGLFSKFTGRMVRWTVRLALLPMLRSELMSLGQMAARGIHED